MFDAIARFLRRWLTEADAMHVGYTEEKIRWCTLHLPDFTEEKVRWCTAQLTGQRRRVKKGRT